MEQSVIEIKNLVKRYKDLLALDHLNMEVRQGEVFWTSRAERFREDHSHQLYTGTLIL